MQSQLMQDEITMFWNHPSVKGITYWGYIKGTTGARMEIDDYCGANLVLFDRCPSCQLLWLDPGKLGTMTLMWARMEARIARVRAESAVLEKDLASFVSAMIFAHGGRLPDGLT